MSSHYAAPADLTDFEAASDPTALHARWDERLSAWLAEDPADPAFFDAERARQVESRAQSAAVWSGLPSTATRLGGSTVAGARLVEDAVALGDADHLAVGWHITGGLLTAGTLVVNRRYRQQDEYLEWITGQDEDGVVMAFTLTT